MQKEVLKWLQSLDLSFAIKQPHRDLSNGFVVAEILSRYYPGVNLHSFDLAINLPARQDNWTQIAKILHSKGLAVPWNLIDGCIHRQPAASERVLAFLYSSLTKKQLPAASLDPVKAPVPNFAQPTASAKVKDPVVERILDDDVRKFRTLEILDQHQRPPAGSDRLLPGAPSGEAEVSRKLRPVSEAETAPVEVKQVQVKTLAAPQLRSSTSTRQVVGDGKTKKIENVTSVGTKSIKIFLAQTLGPLLAKHGLSEDSPLKNVSPTLAAAISDSLLQRVDSVVDLVLKAPAEFYRLWHDVVLPCAASIGNFVQHLFAKMYARDLNYSISVLQDVALADGLRGIPIASLVPTAPEAQPDFLRALKTSLPLPHFQRHLPEVCSAFKSADAEVSLALKHYSVLALNSVDPKVRRAGWRALTTEAVHVHLEVAELQRILAGVGEDAEASEAAVELLAVAGAEHAELKTVVVSEMSGILSRPVSEQSLLSPSMVKLVNMHLPVFSEYLRLLARLDSVTRRNVLADISHKRYPTIDEKLFRSAVLSCLDDSTEAGVVEIAKKANLGMAELIAPALSLVFGGRTQEAAGAVLKRSLAGKTSDKEFSLARALGASLRRSLTRGFVLDEKQVARVLNEDLSEYAVIVKAVLDDLRNEDIERFYKSLLANLQ